MANWVGGKILLPRPQFGNSSDIKKKLIVGLCYLNMNATYCLDIDVMHMTFMFI
jgi:hypothetical protein